jgi:hypothetical protein
MNKMSQFQTPALRVKRRDERDSITFPRSENYFDKCTLYELKEHLFLGEKRVLVRILIHIINICGLTSSYAIPSKFRTK